MEIENLALRKFEKRIYLTIIVISRISSIVYIKEKWEIKNVY